MELGKDKKILYFDIETSPNLGWFWKAGYKINIDYSQIIQERKIICASYKWSGKDKVGHVTWDSKQDDTPIVEKLTELMNQANLVIGHNGDNFDIPWIRTRAIMLGLKPNTDIVSLDTLKLARSGFNFQSNRLNYLAKVLCGIGKLDTGGLDLWLEVWLKNNRSALKRMVAYCDNDVVILERVFERLLPYLNKLPKSFRDITNDRGQCPVCQGVTVYLNGIRTKSNIPYQRYKCGTCDYRWLGKRIKSESSLRN